MKKSDHPHPSRRAKAPEKPALPVGCVRTVKEVAEWFEMSGSGIDEWRNNGCPWTTGAYDLRAITHWAINRAKQRTGPVDSNGAASTISAQLNAEELRFKRARADAREHHNRINQGRYKLVDEMEQEVCRFGVQCADLLQRIPAMMAPRFPADLRDEIVADLSKEIDSCLDAIVNYRVGDSSKVSESESELSE